MSIIHILILIVLSIAIHKIIKIYSNKMLAFFLLFIASLTFNLFFVNIPANKLVLDIAQINNKNFFITIFDLMSSGGTWLLWLGYIFTLFIFLFGFLIMKRMENAVLNAITQAIAMGITEIDTNLISKQINFPKTTIDDLFNIFKASGKIPYNVEISSNKVNNQ